MKQQPQLHAHMRMMVQAAGSIPLHHLGSPIPALRPLPRL
jgi:hypothetical protein